MKYLYTLALQGTSTTKTFLPGRSLHGVIPYQAVKGSELSLDFSPLGLLHLWFHLYIALVTRAKKCCILYQTSENTNARRLLRVILCT
jgi:hypothetical protein